MTAVLTTRALNRATLARQMLLTREKTTALKAVERLVHGRKVVRATLMRATLHLVSTRDYRVLRPLLQPMLSAELRRVLRDRTPGLELEPVVAAARACLEERPRTFDEVRAVLRAAWPRADERALGYAVRTHLPLVQVP